MKIKFLVAAAALVLVGTGTPVAYAALTANSTLTQTITAGTISTDVRNASNAVVSSPSFALVARTVSTSQQSTTGTFGESAQRISVDNPGGANNGWTLALNSVTPATDRWTSGGNTYLYNGTAATGQLTVNANAGTITPLAGTTTGVTKGASTAFSGATPVTILDAAASSDDILNLYITGVTLSQTIPANTPAGSYSLTMVQTLTTK